MSMDWNYIVSGNQSLTQDEDSDTMDDMNEINPEHTTSLTVGTENVNEEELPEEVDDDDELEPVAPNDAMLLDGHPGAETDYTEEPEDVEFPEFPLPDKHVIGGTIKRHDDLVHVQDALGVEATGVYDLPTLKAVKKFQADNKMRAHGKIDKATWEAIRNA